MTATAINVESLPAPRAVEQLGIPYALVADLVLRRVQLEGRTNLQQLSGALALHPAVVDRIVHCLLYTSPSPRDS